ncbi:MAG: EamA family transporter [Bacteroidota bacterium]
MLTLFLLFLAQSSYGLSNCLWKVKGRLLSSWWLLSVRSLVTFPLFLLILYLLDYYVTDSFRPWSDGQWLNAVWALPLSLVGLVMFIRSVRSGFVSKSVPLLGFISFWGILSSVLLFNHSFQLSMMLPSIAMFVGFLLLSTNDFKSFNFDKSLLLAMGAAFCWGITIPAFADLSRDGGTWKLSAIQEGMVLLVATVAYWFKPVTDLRVNKGFGLPVLIGLLTVAGVGGTNYVLGNISPLVFSLLCLAQPAVSLLVAYAIMSERMSRIQWLGTMLLITGSYWLMVDFQ